MKKELRELLELKNEKIEFANAAIKNSEKEAWENAIKEVKEIQAKIDALNEIAAYEELEVNGKTVEEVSPTDKSEIKAFIKYMKTGRVDAALKQSEDEKGGYLVPEDIQTKINEYRRSFVSLKDLVRVEKVDVPSGSRVFEKSANLTPLTEVDELNEIPEVSASTFSQISYKVKDYGGILPVSRTLLQDSPENIMGYLARWFGKKAIVTENAKILEILKSLPKTDATTVDAIKEAMDKTLDPIFLPETKIVTNQSGYHVLNTLKDKNGNYLLQPMVADPTKKAIDGKEVVVISDNFLSGSTQDKYPLFIGSLAEAVTFFDRAGLEVLSTETGGKAFGRNSMDTRMIERFDVQKVDEGAVVYLEIDKKLALVPAI